MHRVFRAFVVEHAHCMDIAFPKPRGKIPLDMKFFIGIPFKDNVSMWVAIFHILSLHILTPMLLSVYRTVGTVQLDGGDDDSSRYTKLCGVRKY